MTKHEKKLKSMLNYFEVELTGVKDEKLSKDQLKNFLDRFNQFMDYYILEEIIKNIKKGRENKSDENDSDYEDEEEDDPMLPKKNKNKNDDLKKDDSIGEELDSFDLNDPIATDINKFLRWLTLVLYSGEHTVVITEDKNGINIKLIKINKGKK